MGKKLHFIKTDVYPYIPKYILFLLLLFISLSCSEEDNDTSDMEIPPNSLLVLPLEETDGFDYYLTDGETDICFKIDTETQKPGFATIKDLKTNNIVHILFNEQGYPVIYEIEDQYVVLNNFSGNNVDMAVISNGEITVHRGLKTDVNWDDGFYSLWNSDTRLRSVDWGKLGSLFLDELKPVVVGIGYGVKTIPAMAKAMLLKDKSAFLDIALNFTEMINEGLPDHKYKKVTEDIISSVSDAKDIYSAGKDCGVKFNIYECALIHVEELFNQVGEAISNMGRPANKETIGLAADVLNYGYGSIQVTLKWDNVNDIDLWVEDPNGEIIYWNHMQSASGGYIDVDNRVAYGPENIFWKGVAIKGNYNVYVHHYEGTSSAGFSVYMKAFDKTRTVQGRIGVGELIHVATFNENNISVHNSILKQTLRSQEMLLKAKKEKQIY